MCEIEQDDWADAESAAAALERIGCCSTLRHTGGAAVSAELCTLLISGIAGEYPASEQLELRRVGYFRLDDLERTHLLAVYARTAIGYGRYSSELLQAIGDNPALEPRDVARLALKLWDGRTSRSSSIILWARSILCQGDPVATRVLGTMSRYWYDRPWEMVEQVERLSAGGDAALEVYVTLVEDHIRATRASGLDSESSRRLVEAALSL